MTLRQAAPGAWRLRTIQAYVRVAAADPTATLGDRMIAIVLDGLLLFVLIGSLVVLGAHRWNLIPQSRGSISPAELTAAGSFAAIVGILYFWLCEGLTGATLARRSSASGSEASTAMLHRFAKRSCGRSFA